TTQSARSPIEAVSAHPTRCLDHVCTLAHVPGSNDPISEMEERAVHQTTDDGRDGPPAAGCQTVRETVADPPRLVPLPRRSSLVLPALPRPLTPLIGREQE